MNKEEPVPRVHLEWNKIGGIKNEECNQCCPTKSLIDSIAYTTWHSGACRRSLKNAPKIGVLSKAVTLLQVARKMHIARAVRKECVSGEYHGSGTGVLEDRRAVAEGEDSLGADTGGCCEEMVEWCGTNHVNCVLGFAGNKRLRRKIGTATR